MLTKEQKDIHLSDPTKCPKCLSVNLDQNNIIISSDVESMGILVRCFDCDSFWYNYFKMTDVESV